MYTQNFTPLRVKKSFNEPMTRFELVTSSLPRKRSTPELHRPAVFWAGDEIRTRDVQLGRLTLYQLSYSRLLFLIFVGMDGLEPTIPWGDRFTVCCNSHYATSPTYFIEPMEGLEPPVFVFRFTRAVLSPLSHIGILSTERDSNPRWSFDYDFAGRCIRHSTICTYVVPVSNDLTLSCM